MFIFHNFGPWQVIKRVSPFHASEKHKARVIRECENKNMKIFTSVASTWYVEDSKIDFKNENTAHGNRLLLFYKSKIIVSKKTNISPTIARNIPIAVRIANQTRRTVPVRIATPFSKHSHVYFILSSVRPIFVSCRTKQ